MERHSYYAHARPLRQFAIVSISHRVAGDFHSPAFAEYRQHRNGYGSKFLDPTQPNQTLLVDEPEPCPTLGQPVDTSATRMTGQREEIWEYAA